jgi:hypothetical protein
MRMTTSPILQQALGSPALMQAWIIRRAEAATEADSTLKALGAVMEADNLARPLYDTPIGVPDRLTLSKPERATYAANLAGAGPAALHTAAVEVISTNDAALAMAVIVRLQAMPLAERPFSPLQLAQRIQRKEITKAHEMLGILARRTQDAILATRAIRTPRTGPLAHIIRGLRPAEPDPEED